MSWLHPEPDSADHDGLTYSVRELKEIFLDFYEFLGKLHFDPADLRVPPPEGWPNLPPTDDGSWGFKNARVVEVMRHLPYYHSKRAVHYKSALVDYTSVDPAYFRERDSRVEDEEGDNELLEELDIDPRDVLYVAWGHESGGRELMLHVPCGEIVEETLRGGCSNVPEPVDVREYFGKLKEAYRSLRLVPCAGKVTIEARRVPERRPGDGPVTEAAVRAQAGARWGTDLDVQYVRQVYRQHGWPDAFRREEAMGAVRRLSDSLELEGGRGGWEDESEDFLELEWRG